MTGTPTEAAMAAALAVISDTEASPRSGIPSLHTEVPAPVMYTAGKPSRSMIFAVRQSYAPGATMIPGSLSIRRNLVVGLIKLSLYSCGPPRCSGGGRRDHVVCRSSSR